MEGRESRYGSAKLERGIQDELPRRGKLISLKHEWRDLEWVSLRHLLCLLRSLLFKWNASVRLGEWELQVEQEGTEKTEA